MKPSSVSKAVIAGVFIATACLLLFNFNDSSEVTSYISKQYSETYKLQRNISMAATVNQLSNNKQQNNQNGSAGSWDDLRPLAKELSSYYDHYSHALNTAHIPNGQPNEITIEFEGTSRTINPANGDRAPSIRADCSGGVSAMLFFMGIESNNPSPHSTDYETYGNAIDPAPQTFADLEVGDILIQNKGYNPVTRTTQGHVAMVAYKDNDKLYTFDWGSDDGIRDCGDKGWHGSYALTASLSTWRTRGTLTFRRPIKSN